MKIYKEHDLVNDTFIFISDTIDSVTFLNANKGTLLATQKSPKIPLVSDVKNIKTYHVSDDEWADFGVDTTESCVLCGYPLNCKKTSEGYAICQYHGGIDEDIIKRVIRK